MPLIRIDLVKEKSRQYRAQLGDIVYRTLVDVLDVPRGDHFQVIQEHKKGDIPSDRDYLGVHRSKDCIFLKITLNCGRSVELKQRFYATVTNALREG